MRARVLVYLLALSAQPWNAFGMEVDLFAHKDKFGQSLNMDISERECTNVPRPWVNVTMSIDTHGSCMQFYDGKSCTGRIAVIQPFHTVHQMDLSLINFHNVIQSISPCGAKVPTGRYVVQSAVDASILTVSKYENQFAFVHTLPPRAFIPKAQQWEIHEKAPTEYDVMPRIHETNTPVTYDSEAMKRGSFIRKVWKIESVGRGRYVFKNEWSGKCLYKTRFRTIEEHDCRAWSPNQEWVLRPLLTLPKPTAPTPAQISDEVKYQVPSRIVDQYLEQQKFLREQEDIADGKTATYKIKNRRKKPKPETEQNSFRARKQQTEPPKPEVFYSRSQPSFLRRHFSRYSQPRPDMMYMEGTYPIYDQLKVEDPVFPDFLLHAVSHDDEPDSDETPDKYKAPRYAVTRRPITIPLPTGHPNFSPGKPKYDGRLKDPEYRKKLEESEESEEEEEDQGPEPQTEAQVEEALLRDKQERHKNRESEESEEEHDDDNGGEEEEEEQEEKTEAQKIRDRDAAKESEEDPAVSVASFMKLLFKGISNKMQDEEKEKEEMIHTFE